VLVAFEGDVKLTDFGIAKALDLMYNEEGKVIAGKDEYLSPEQAPAPISSRSASSSPNCCSAGTSSAPPIARNRGETS
jgi:eukaryotic-like serine/threonine-protein kinase